jgi:GR25 family glycosyltransferase involved in LPS biosynthesis
MKNIKIFIPHYTKLIDRRPVIEKILIDEGFQTFTFFEAFDKEQVDESRFSNNEELIRSRIQNFIPERVVRNFLRDGLTQGEKSLSLKHENIYKTFLESSTENDLLLVLEDDVRLCYNFKKYIEVLCEKCVFDCLNFSAGAASQIVPSSENELKQIQIDTVSHHPFNTGTEAYLMSRKCVERVYSEIGNNKLCLPIDWELSHIFMSLKDIKCKRTNPPICYQASQIGQYESSIRERKNDY